MEIYSTNIVYNKVQLFPYFVCYYNSRSIFIYIVFIIQILSSYFIISATYSNGHLCVTVAANELPEVED